MSLTITKEIKYYAIESQNNGLQNEYAYAVKQQNNVSIKETVKSYCGTYNIKSSVYDDDGNRWVIAQYNKMIPESLMDSEQIVFITGKPKNTNPAFQKNILNKVEHYVPLLDSSLDSSV